MKCDSFKGISCRSEVGRQIRGVHGGSEMLLAQGGQGSLEHSSLASQKHAEIDLPECRSVNGGQQQEADPIWCDREATQAGSYGFDDLPLFLWRLHFVGLQSGWHLYLNARLRPAHSQGTSGVEVHPNRAVLPPPQMGVDVFLT